MKDDIHVLVNSERNHEQSIDRLRASNVFFDNDKRFSFDSSPKTIEDDTCIQMTLFRRDVSRKEGIISITTTHHPLVQRQRTYSTSHRVLS